MVASPGHLRRRIPVLAALGAYAYDPLRLVLHALLERNGRPHNLARRCPWEACALIKTIVNAVCVVCGRRGLFMVESPSRVYRDCENGFLESLDDKA